MKLFDAVGKDHEEFKLQLNKDRDIELAEINIRQRIAQEQAKIVSEGLKSAKIEIVGGENRFFERLVNSITTGKSVDGMVTHSNVLGDVRKALLGPDAQAARDQICKSITQFGLRTEDLKNLTISALVLKLIARADSEQKGVLNGILNTIKELGLGEQPAREWVAGQLVK
jgi:hypothetical protein